VKKTQLYLQNKRLSGMVFTETLKSPYFTV